MTAVARHENPRDLGGRTEAFSVVVVARPAPMDTTLQLGKRTQTRSKLFGHRTRWEATGLVYDSLSST
jgi:hypothetical protein